MSALESLHGAIETRLSEDASLVQALGGTIRWARGVGRLTAWPYLRWGAVRVSALDYSGAPGCEFRLTLDVVSRGEGRDAARLTLAVRESLGRQPPVLPAPWRLDLWQVVYADTFDRGERREQRGLVRLHVRMRRAG